VGGRKEAGGHPARIPLTEVLDGGDDDDIELHSTSSGDEEEQIAEGAVGGGSRSGSGGSLWGQPVRRSLPV